MNYGELKKLLKKNGCNFRKEGKRHEIWHSTKTGESFPVGRHSGQEVPSGTLKNILKAAGLA